MSNAARWLDDLGPEYPECHVALIDALRDYIRNHEIITDDFLRDGTISIEQAKAAEPHIDRCRALLKEIEGHSFDPSLCGLIRGK
jgi:hypothetical protein